MLLGACANGNGTAAPAAVGTARGTLVCERRVANMPRKSFMPYTQGAMNFAEVHAAVAALTADGWRLPHADELRAWLNTSNAANPASPACDAAQPRGLYWATAPDRASSLFAWYVYWPTGEAVEYGDLYLPAWLVLVREDAPLR
ncbi:hypothetical protein [Paraburkholderia caledonica]|uniref:DUF1566 domain-containing protein n=1 Tax=Paraburkholderia caledonica TaxID=134536 RepID=A0AB73IIE2_9BURK|nr:hypothetical protein [Paraburkholderia caledonica]